MVYDPLPKEKEVSIQQIYIWNDGYPKQLVLAILIQ